MIVRLDQRASRDLQESCKIGRMEPTKAFGDVSGGGPGRFANLIAIFEIASAR